MGPAMTEASLHDRVLDCLDRNYGLTGSLQRLPGENLNFLVTTDQGQRFVFKIVGPDMPEEVVEMECAAIRHAVSAGFGTRLPEILQNKNDNIETRIELPVNGSYRSRLMTFVDGKSMADISDISTKLLENVGETVASFAQAMRNFDHPAAHRDHRWNLVTAGQHEAGIRAFGDRDSQALLAWAYRGWQAARQRLGGLPWQFIHGDAHDENLLVEGDRVTGLIDFGDCCHNPAVCDLAICLTYLMMRGPDPLTIAAAVTDGYRRARPVSAEELCVLYPLIGARLAVTLCVAQGRKAIDPSNPNWFGGEQSAWRLLEELQTVGRERFERSLQ
jgi:Ser/Thr protein kinase RdoA (MazF antagonist)